MTTKAKRFGGLDLGQIATQSDGAPPTDAPTRPSVPIGELAMRGASMTPHERQTILLADPKRCRPWKFHNRHSSWYTQERCRDLIESIAKNEQQEPALGRKLEGDPDFDYEVIYGMRRRFSTEFLNKPFKIRIVSVDDKQAAVLMHQENHDRQDISAMERAISYTQQLRGKVFKTQDEIALALNVTKGMVSQMVMAAELLDTPAIAKLLPDPTLIPVKGAYAVATLMSDAERRATVLNSAKHLATSPKLAQMTPAKILKFLAGAPERSSKVEPLKKVYNVGQAGRMVLTRNGRGKVTLAFSSGLTPELEEDVLIAVRSAFKDL